MITCTYPEPLRRSAHFEISLFSKRVCPRHERAFVASSPLACLPAVNTLVSVQHPHASRHELVSSSRCKSSLLKVSAEIIGT